MAKSGTNSRERHTRLGLGNMPLNESHDAWLGFLLYSGNHGKASFWKGGTRGARQSRKATDHSALRPPPCWGILGMQFLLFHMRVLSTMETFIYLFILFQLCVKEWCSMCQVRAFWCEAALITNCKGRYIPVISFPKEMRHRACLCHMLHML